MSYGNQSEGTILRNHISIGTRKPPFSSPASVILSGSNTQKSSSRSGNNSPYIRGGVIVVPVRKAISYRTIVGFYMKPVRSKEYYWDKKSNRRRFRWVIIYKRKNVWGVRVKVVTRYTRIRQEDPGLLLKPNNLNYDATINAEASGQSFQIASQGLPQELNVVTTQSGIIIGGVAGAAAQVNLGTPGIPWPSTSQLSSSLDRKALSALYSRVNEESTNLALIAAESGKTLDMLLSIFMSGVQLMRSLKRLDLDRARRIIVGNNSQDLANRWLAFQYGVKPLLSDISGIMEDLGREARAWRKYTGVRSDSIKTEVITPGSTLTKTRFKFEIDLTFKHSVIVDTNLSIGRFLRGSGFTNVPGLAWELIPFSFVIDWFIPIGNYLNSCQSFQSSTRYYWTTVTTLYHCEWETFHNAGSTFKSSGSGPSGSTSRITCVRSVKPTVPSLPLPSINREPLNVTRILSALSLYLQRK